MEEKKDFEDNTTINEKVDTGGTVTLDNKDDLGESVALDDNVDLGGTVALDDNVDLGGTVALDDNADLGETVVLDDNADLGETVVLDDNAGLEHEIVLFESSSFEENISLDLNKFGNERNSEIQPEVKKSQLKFRARTLFVPLLFGLFFVFVQAVSMVIYILVAMGDQLAGLDSSGYQKMLQTLLLDGNVSTYGTFIMAAVIIPVLYFYIKRRSKKYPQSLLAGPLKKRPLITSLAAITVGILGVNLLVLGLQFMSQYVPYIGTKFAEYEKLIGLIIPGEVNPILNFLTVVVLVPICEELLFRGVMMGEFMLAMNKPAAAILTGVVFALFHGNFIQTSYVIIPGMILSFAYYLTGSLKVPILLHCWFNFMGGFLPTVLGADDVNNSGSTTYTIILLAAYAISIGYLIYTAVKRRENRQVA